MPRRRRIDRSRTLEAKGASAPTDAQIKSLLFWAREGRNPERNEAILFFQLLGFRISETAQVTVEMLMWPTGKWRDIVHLPAAICKNGHANQIVFVNRRARIAFDQYVELRLKKGQRTTKDKHVFRGLQPHSPFILSEGGRGFSLKKKERETVDGEPVTYWAADTLQNLFSTWCKNAGWNDELSSHCGRKAFATRLSQNPHTSSEDIISTLVRHEQSDLIYLYVHSSGSTQGALLDLYESL